MAISIFFSVNPNFDLSFALQATDGFDPDASVPDALQVDFPAAVFFIISSFDICHETTDKY